MLNATRDLLNIPTDVLDTSNIVEVKVIVNNLSIYYRVVTKSYDLIIMCDTDKIMYISCTKKSVLDRVSSYLNVIGYEIRTQTKYTSESSIVGVGNSPLSQNSNIGVV